MPKPLLSALALGLGFLVSYPFSAQVAPSIEWQRALGGSLEDRAESVKRTSDGGYIVAGGANSSDGDASSNQGSLDVWVVKLNEAGVIQWQRNFGGSWADVANAVLESNDGGVVVAGIAGSSDGDIVGHHGSADFWILKLDAMGSLQWQSVLGGSAGDAASSIAQTSDGGYVVVGGTSSNDGDVAGNHGAPDFWVVKLDASGGLQWQRCLGGSGWEVAQSVKQTNDGGYIVAGNTSSNDGDVFGNHGGYDAWVVRLNATGQIEWQRALGGSEIDGSSDVIETEDGNFIVAANTDSQDGDIQGHHGGMDAWIVKLDASGGLLWQAPLGGSSYEPASAILELDDNSLVLVGWTSSYDGDVSGVHGVNGAPDAWLVKLNADGTVQWQRCLGGSNSESAPSIDILLDQGFIVAAKTDSDDGDVTGHHGEGDMWIVKLGPDDVAVNETNKAQVQFTPNPTHGLMTVAFGEAEELRAVSCVDVSGRVVHEAPVNGFISKITLDLSDFESGLYLLRVEFEDGTWLVERVEKY